MNIFVGNLSYSSTEDGLRSLFDAFGEVATVKIIKSWDTGRSRGFGFVEMPNDEEARAAISAIDGKELDGRPVRVNQAQPKAATDRGSGGSSRQNRW